MVNFMKFPSFCSPGLLSLGTTLLAFSLLAEPPASKAPGAGILEREVEKQYEANPLDTPQPRPEIQIDIPEERFNMPDGKRVFIHQIQIRGNEVISTAELCKALSFRMDQELSIKEIYELCNIVEQVYAKKGYFLARAYPPEQTIENDTLVIEVIEGRLGAINIEGGKHYRKSFILSYFSSLRGKPLNYDDFLRALLLLNENRDLQVASVLEKGQAFGTVDLILRVKDKAPWHLYLNANDWTTMLDGNTRWGGRLDGGNILGNGDTFSAIDVEGYPLKSMQFDDFIYTFPIGRNGMKMDLSYLFSYFNILKMRDLHLRGKSMIAGGKLTQALQRKRFTSVDGYLSFDYKQVKNFTLGSLASFDKIRLLTLGFTYDHYHRTGGRDYAVLKGGAGIPDILGGMPEEDPSCSRHGGGGQFTVFNLDYDRLQHVYKDMFFAFHASGQYSPNKLTIPQQIYIGGSDTVRGYPLSAALGDFGYYLNFELRTPPPLIADKHLFSSKKKIKESVQLAVFLDDGMAKFHQQGAVYLTGVGIGLRVQGPWKINMTLDWGFPLLHRDTYADSCVYLKFTNQTF